MKLCTDCVHFVDLTSKCRASKGAQEPTHGFDIAFPLSAFTARTAEVYCGVEAKWFKPKA